MEQTVKALTGEIVQLRFVEGGVPVLLPSATAIVVSVRAAKGAVLLAEVTSFTAPETAAGGFYEGRLSFATTAVQDLLDASPTKNTFSAVAAVSWTIPAAAEPEESDDLVLQLQRKVGSTDGEDPLVLSTPWEWIKARVLAGDNLTRSVDDDAQTLTFAGATMGVATKAQAEAGAVNTHVMTPLRTFEALTKQIMIPFRLVAAGADLIVGNYDLVTLPRDFLIDSFRLTFDGPLFESPGTTFEFSLAQVGGGETTPVLSYAAMLTTQSHSPSFSPTTIPQNKLLRLSVTAFEGVGYSGGTAKGGVVWLGGRWA